MIPNCPCGQEPMARIGMAAWYGLGYRCWFKHPDFAEAERARPTLEVADAW